MVLFYCLEFSSYFFALVTRFEMQSSGSISTALLSFTWLSLDDDPLTSPPKFAFLAKYLQIIQKKLTLPYCKFSIVNTHIHRYP